MGLVKITGRFFGGNEEGLFFLLFRFLMRLAASHAVDRLVLFGDLLYIDRRKVEASKFRNTNMCIEPGPKNASYHRSGEGDFVQEQYHNNNTFVQAYKVHCPTIYIVLTT